MSVIRLFYADGTESLIIRRDPAGVVFLDAYGAF
jgi:hypothetical protein